MKQLDEIRARYEAATPGPWLYGEISFTDPGEIYGAGHLLAKTYYSRDNDAFIAHARTDIPRLEQALRAAVGALSFYQTEDYFFDDTGYDTTMECDRGSEARKTLEQIQKILEGKA